MSCTFDSFHKGSSSQCCIGLRRSGWAQKKTKFQQAKYKKKQLAKKEEKKRDSQKKANKEGKQMQTIMTQKTKQCNKKANTQKTM